MMVYQLKAEAKHSRCGERLAKCDAFKRQGIFCDLEHERFMRKFHDIEDMNTIMTSRMWNDVFYTMYMRIMSDVANREAFVEITRRVRFSVILRERANPRYVEAMLVGVSGLLDCYPNEEYVESLREDVDYLFQKYNLKPLSPLNWNLARVHPTNHPVVKLSQASELLCKSEFLFNQLLLCESMSDIDEIFSANVSKLFMDTHPHMACDGRETISVSGEKKILLGINLVAPVMYAYGNYIHDDRLCSQAHDLNESLPAENNRFIKHWRSQGVIVNSSYESQALIQLSTVYCKKSRCEDCPVGRAIVSGEI